MIDRATLIRLHVHPLATMSEMISVIRLDAKLTATMLKLVNSSVFELPRKIETLNMLTVTFGARSTAVLALLTESLPYFPRGEVGMLEAMYAVEDQIGAELNRDDWKYPRIVHTAILNPMLEHYEVVDRIIQTGGE